MQWTDNKLASLTTKKGFRLRGESMTRMEVFSDAAFAFALTMLVVSVGSIPQNHQELMLALKNVPAFALSFAQLAAFWMAHRVWSSQYGLEDRISTILTLLMIFTILVFVYPLRLIFASFCAFMTGGWLTSHFQVSSLQELASLFIIYGVGYAILAGVLTLLYWHALRREKSLRLNRREVLATRFGITAWGMQVAISTVAAVVAWLVPEPLIPFAGFVYFGLAIAMPIISIRYHKQLESITE